MPPKYSRRRVCRLGGSALRRGARLLPGAVGLIGLALSGCATPVGVLEPTAAPAPDATHLDILVATTRAASSGRGVLFSNRWSEASLATSINEGL